MAAPAVELRLVSRAHILAWRKDLAVFLFEPPGRR
jgi:hypothetical protein